MKTSVLMVVPVFFATLSKLGQCMTKCKKIIPPYQKLSFKGSMPGQWEGRT